MQVTGVGSGNSYNYDMQTKRLSSVDGTTDDAFIRYFNDDTNGTDSSTLNGYDRRTKGVIKNAIDRIQEFYEAGLMDKPLAQDGDSTITVSYEIEDSTTTSVSVNGEKRLTMVDPMLYLPDELSLLSTDAPEFKTKVHQDYDPSDNSNNTHCEVRDGRICEVGNRTGVPTTVYNKALAGYEELLSMPLSGQKEE